MHAIAARYILVTIYILLATYYGKTPVYALFCLVSLGRWVIWQPHHKGFSASHWLPGTSVADDARRLDCAKSCCWGSKSVSLAQIGSAPRCMGALRQFSRYSCTSALICALAHPLIEREIHPALPFGGRSGGFGGDNEQPLGRYLAAFQDEGLHGLGPSLDQVALLIDGHLDGGAKLRLDLLESQGSPIGGRSRLACQGGLFCGG